MGNRATIRRKIEISLPQLVHTYPKYKKIHRRSKLIDRLKLVEDITDVDIYIPAISEYKHDTEVKFIMTIDAPVDYDVEYLKDMYKECYNIIISMCKNFKV